MKFLDYFPDCVFQVFDDKGKDRSMARVITRCDEDLFRKLNKQGAGIYFTPNAFSGGRKKENLKRIQAVYADIDVAKEGGDVSEVVLRRIYKALLTEKLVPNFIIRTKNGLQPIWLIDEDKVDAVTQKKAVDVICGIIEWSKEFGGLGDKVKDVTRVLRLPNYDHMKGEPFKCTARKHYDKKYTLDFMAEAFPYKEEKPVYKALKTKYKKHDLSLEIDRLDFPELVIRAFAGVGRHAEFDNQRRLVLDGRLTGGHLGKINDGDFLCSNSHEPFTGNRITAPAGILQITNKEARAWIIEEYGLKKRVLSSTIDKIQKVKVKKSDKPFAPFTWGTPGLDERIWAMKKYQFCIIAGETMGGKSAYAFFMAIENAKLGHKVLFINLEMFEDEMIDRMASDYAGVTILEDRLEQYPEKKLKLMEEKREEIKSIENLEIVSIPSDVPRTIEVVMELIKRKKADVAIIDNLDKIAASPEVSSFGRTEHITNALISFTNEEQIPVLLLHHYNQKSGSGDRTIESLRGSTKAGHDSDVVLFLSRTMEEDASDKDKARLIVKAKKIRRKGVFCVGAIYYNDGSFYDEFPEEKKYEEVSFWQK